MNNPGIAVDKYKSEKIIRKLLSMNIIRKDLKIRQEGELVMIPLRQQSEFPGYATFEMEFEPRNIQKHPSEAIRKASGAASKKLAIPDRWIRLGDALIIKGERKPSDIVLHSISRVMGVKSIYIDRGKIEGEMRHPRIEIIYGKPETVVHLENGIRYSLDPSRVMFSPGNVNERILHGKMSLQGASVLDMFAGIGYFSLPLAKYTHLSKIYAVEINPESYSFLRKNIEINRLQDKVLPVLGDSRDVSPVMKFDYIVMGHFSSGEFLSAALIRSRPGTVLNMHQLVPTHEISTYWYGIISLARRLGYLVDFVEQRKVKSYGPHLWHMSLDLAVARCPHVIGP
ncbi:MAG: class I SAM-dependent methyltransferase family protein [Thermoplasmataceae archaeon]